MSKRKPFIVKNSNKQRVWSYIGRNRTFCMSDISSVLEIPLVSVQSFLWSLRKIDYVRVVRKTEQTKDWIFKCVKHTGSTSPSINNLSVFDHNTQERFIITSPLKEREAIFKTLVTMQKQPFCIADVMEIHQNATHGKINHIVSLLRKKEVLVLDSIREHRKMFFKINKEFKNILRKETHEEDVATCPVCHSVHTATKIKKQIFNFNNRRYKK